ncbi:conserved hypothetical protein [Thermotomaculum hydrothermale]|uniref:AB hydrolase-1 domain-containing protein n=1 Tax=Thermotomaculum hydrothermale TaxID=981385 RepID=A0A7R6PZ83_9BACT|nr:alpha/beta hydrolase [Thermotomaculum hydrothermale]BBB33650.1 conserved hypothetical protein [Thermotomaculum hydrothermale]
MKLYSETMGQGKTILFIHGFGVNTYTWRYLMPEFSKSYKCIAINLKGFGKSPKPFDNKYSFFDHLENVLKFIEENRLKDFVIVGNSYGGGLAMGIALEYKKRGIEENLKGLVLIDTMAYIQELPPFMKILTLPVISEILSILIPPSVATKNALKEVWHNYHKVTEDVVNAYKVKSIRDRYCSIKTARQILKGNIEGFVNGIKEIDTKSLIIWGDKDKIIPIKTAYKLEKDLKNSRLEIIENCGHVPQEECPEKTIEIIKNFLKEIEF